jgi:hypothetical protein
MTSKENCNENLRKSISGIFGKKFVGPHCNALLACLLLYKCSLSFSYFLYNFFDIPMMRNSIWISFY